MTISETTSSALMAFPKYPELPTELRLKIIEETLDSASSTDRWAHSKDERRMSIYACVDREWNKVVELRLFKDINLFSPFWANDWATSTIQQELMDFGAICGKRSGRVSRILVGFYDFGRDPSDTHPHLHILSQIFELMKAWNHREREQRGLIELRLGFGFMEDPLSWRPEYPCDLSKFPQVPVLGSIHEPRPGYHAVGLHPCILAGLCRKLPNIRHASLTLPAEPSGYISTENFISEFTAHDTKSFLPPPSCIRHHWNFADRFRCHGLFTD